MVIVRLDPVWAGSVMATEVGTPTYAVSVASVTEAGSMYADTTTGVGTGMYFGPASPAGLFAWTKRNHVPAAPKTHVASDKPEEAAADAHTTCGAASVGLVDASTAMLELTASPPTSARATVFCSPVNATVVVVVAPVG